MTAEEVFAAVQKDSLERLRWRVCCRFGILPGSKRAKRLSSEDLIVCGAHMVLDCRLRSAVSGGSGDDEAARNVGFDDGRFAEMAGVFE